MNLLADPQLPDDLIDLRAALQRGAEDALPALERLGCRARAAGTAADLGALLETLTPDLQTTTPVLYWRFSCALRGGRGEALLVEVETHLAAHEAPELRALYAGTLAPFERAFSESERAYRALPSPLTAYQCGRLHPDAAAGTALLHESVALAERAGDRYAAARNAGALVSRLVHAGRYREAAHWGAWALAGPADPYRQALLVNDLAYARLLGGDHEGLDDLLGGRDLAGALPEHARLYRGTLADLLLSRGDAARALALYRANFGESPRRLLGGAALDLVRGLLELGEQEEARAVAERAFCLTRGDAATWRGSAELALGMALLHTEPGRADELLAGALAGFLEPLEAHRAAQAALHLAYVRLGRGDRAGARGALLAAHAGLAELSYGGFRLLLAPADGDAVWELASCRGCELELYVLGRAEAWLGGVRVPLSARERDLVALLALHPGGLGLEALHGLLGEPGRSATKTAVSRLRAKLPVSAAPYRFEVEVYSDAAALRTALKRGDLGEALRLYRGELLADSGAPGVVDLRDTLASSLHAAALRSNDPDALLAVAERAGDDLQLWESALELLGPKDNRAPVVRARVRQLRAAWER